MGNGGGGGGTGGAAIGDSNADCFGGRGVTPSVAFDLSLRRDVGG